MRATTLFAGALLAMVVAAPRAARCAGTAGRPGGRGTLVLTIAKVNARGAKIRELRTMLGSASASSGVVEAAVELPQFALAIANGSSQLSVAPTYEKIGRSRSPGVALSGRF
jgi:hypothetical protein